MGSIGIGGELAEVLGWTDIGVEMAKVMGSIGIGGEPAEVTGWMGELAEVTGWVVIGGKPDEVTGWIVIGDELHCEGPAEVAVTGAEEGLKRPSVELTCGNET